ncbi:hypothetical protein PG5_30450 [Pseudomonas sp. G5(2012)]|jgi:16S rRNA G527 N7-methylase RsmG|nr:hypothetical protein PG5_30450 [Pseudomonas sp. G5(2012)]
MNYLFTILLMAMAIMLPNGRFGIVKRISKMMNFLTKLRKHLTLF